MGEPVTTGLAIASLVGSAVSGAAAIKSSSDQRKAARAAAQAAADAADTSVTAATSTTAAKPTESQASSEHAVQSAAKRRMTISDTINRFQSNGFRKQLN